MHIGSRYVYRSVTNILRIVEYGGSTFANYRLLIAFTLAGH